jgi:antirestriction protein ArdC
MPPTPSAESYQQPRATCYKHGAAKKSYMNESVYQVVTNRIIGLLEKGVIPWQQNWKSAEQAPQNLISRKPYRGINAFLLSAMHYASPYWLTYKQTQDLGGHVKRGEKACPVVFWKWLDVENEETGKTERIPLLRYFSVFNVAQCEGITVPTVAQAVRDCSPIQAAEQIIASMPKRPEIKHGQARAFYSPSGDFVGMPSAEQFKTDSDYCSVLFHELTHSTGHETRLNRKGVTGSEGNWSAFGSNPYAKEELVAEMGAAFLSAETGIVERTIDNSAAYVAAWLQKLKNDSRLVVQAAAQAQRAADWILGKWQDGTPAGSEQN